MPLQGETFFGDSIWDRTGRNTISRRLYLLMICFWTTVGIAFSGWMSTFSQDSPGTPGSCWDSF
ncbi:MAG TPA: hypothetical protein VFZ58_03465 [Candidatus Saccharimonadales bacterium]